MFYLKLMCKIDFFFKARWHLWNFESNFVLWSIAREITMLWSKFFTKKTFILSWRSKDTVKILVFTFRWKKNQKCEFVLFMNRNIFSCTGRNGFTLLSIADNCIPPLLFNEVFYILVKSFSLYLRSWLLTYGRYFENIADSKLQMSLTGRTKNEW